MIFYFKGFGETDYADRNNRDVDNDGYRSSGSRADVDRYSPGYNNYFGSNSEDNSGDKDGTFG